jgi:hypothetical protein
LAKVSTNIFIYLRVFLSLVLFLNLFTNKNC